jgi:hypothetical protein
MDCYERHYNASTTITESEKWWHKYHDERRRLSRFPKKVLEVVQEQRTREEQPDYTGTAMLEMPDGSAKEYRLSAWRRTTKAGAPFIGGFIKPSLPQTELIPAVEGNPTDHEW